MTASFLIRASRSLLAAFFFAFFGLGGLLIGGGIFPVLLLFGRSERVCRAMRTLVRTSWRLFVVGARVTGLFRVSVSPEDRARLAETRGKVVVANHVTLIDVVVLATCLPDATSIAKAAAGRNFFYSRIVRSAFLVNDDPGRVLDDAQRLLKGGTNVVVFPEGTRVPVTATGRTLRRGAAQIALHARVPILPVAITCEPPVLAKGQPWYDVAARVITWTLTVKDEIPVPPPGRMSGHAAAAALTHEIYGRLWPKEVMD
ncbi:MAG: lysophospholipid acyltransferase family protein [Kiritimatiellia bacterium]